MCCIALIWNNQGIPEKHCWLTAEEGIKNAHVKYSAFIRPQVLGIAAL